MSKTPHIVSTRKLNSSRVAELEKQGWTFTQHDFIHKIIDVPSECKKESIEQNIVLTSKSGVEAFLKVSESLKLDPTAYSIYSISQATTEAAIAVGLKVKANAPNASSLADEILKDKTILALTHICGNRRRNELSEKLNGAGVLVHDVMAYRTELTSVAINQHYDGILFFSPSAVDSFLSINTLKTIPCFCIGPTTGDHAKQKGYLHVYFSDAPTEEALLNLLTNYFHKTPAHA
jgi:uroporphyrinogen-III synthase